MNPEEVFLKGLRESMKNLEPYNVLPEPYNTQLNLHIQEREEDLKADVKNKLTPVCTLLGILEGWNLGKDEFLDKEERELYLKLMAKIKANIKYIRKL